MSGKRGGNKAKQQQKPFTACFGMPLQQQQQRQPVDSKIDPADLSSIRFTTSGIELRRREMWEKDLQGKIKETE